MKIELTKNQYEHLIELLFTGAWMINAGKNPGNYDSRYVQTLQHVYSYGSLLDSADLVGFDEKHQEFYPSVVLETRMLEHVNRYNDHCFQEELIVKLVQKHRRERPCQSPADAMHQEERIEEEVRRYGIESLEADWSGGYLKIAEGK